MKLGMTFALGVVLLVLGIIFGVIFWENEAEGTGEFGSCTESLETGAYDFALWK